MQTSTVLAVILTNCLLTLSASTQPQPHELKLIVPLHKYSIESSLRCEDRVVASANGTSQVDMLFVMSRIANETLENNRSLIQYKSMVRQLHQLDLNTRFQKIIIHLPTPNRTFKQVTDEIDQYIRYFKPNFGGMFLDDGGEEFDSDVMDYLKFQVIDSQRLNSNDLFISNRIFTGAPANISGNFWSPRLVYEFTCATWLASSSSPNKLRANLAIMIRDCASTSEMERAVDKAFVYQVGYVFVTNDSEWRSLPDYFDQQIAYIAERNNQTINSSREISFTNWIISAFVIFVCLVLVALLALTLVFIFMELKKLVHSRKQRVKLERRPIYNEYALPNIIVSNEEENNEEKEKFETNEIFKEEKKQTQSDSSSYKKKKSKKNRYSLQPSGSMRNGMAKCSSLQSISENQ